MALYRAVIDYGDEPPFFLEPYTPREVSMASERAGFSVAASYASSVQQGVQHADPRIARGAALMHEGNRSLSWSGRFGRVFRRYALCRRER
jgi:hypothetical protein